MYASPNKNGDNFRSPIASSSKRVCDDFNSFYPIVNQCIMFNARSIVNKLQEFPELVARTNPLILSVVETWVRPEVSNTELGLANYIVCRMDRNRNGGGVLLTVHKSLSPLHRGDLSNPEMEAVWCEAKICKIKVLLGTVYRSHKFSKCNVFF